MAYMAFDAAAPLSPGVVVHDRYRILEIVGQGGLGTVYQVVDVIYGKHNVYALKELIDQSPGARKQFELESRWLQELDHNHIPKVRESFEWGGRVYLVMDFVDGDNLEQILMRGGGAPLPEQEVLHWILPICDALQYLHTRTPPILHRDVKPSNIIVTPDGHPVLVDFGIAKEHLPGANRTATFVRKAGTEGYAPPEQYSAGGPTGPWSDVYGLGATLYQLLTGQIPPTAVERIALDVQMPHPRKLNPALSAYTDAAIWRALSIRPADRFQSILEFARALVPAVQSYGTGALQPAQPSQTNTPPRANMPGGFTDGLRSGGRLGQIGQTGALGATSGPNSPHPQNTPRPASAPPLGNVSSASGMLGRSSGFSEPSGPFSNSRPQAASSPRPRPSPSGPSAASAPNAPWAAPSPPPAMTRPVMPTPSGPSSISSSSPPYPVVQQAPTPVQTGTAASSPGSLRSPAKQPEKPTNHTLSVIGDQENREGDEKKPGRKDGKKAFGRFSRAQVIWSVLLAIVLVVAIILATVASQLFAPIDRSSPQATVNGYFNALRQQNYTQAWQFMSASRNDPSSQSLFESGLRTDDARYGKVLTARITQVTQNAGSSATVVVAVTRADQPTNTITYSLTVTNYGSDWLIDTVNSE